MSSELSHWSTITNEFEPAIDPGLDTAHLDYDTVPTPAPSKQKRRRVNQTQYIRPLKIPNLGFQARYQTPVPCLPSTDPTKQLVELSPQAVPPRKLPSRSVPPLALPPSAVLPLTLLPQVVPPLKLAPWAVLRLALWPQAALLLTILPRAVLTLAATSTTARPIAGVHSIKYVGLDGLQKALQGFQPTFQLSNKLLERAQQLMKLPEEARLLAILLLIVNMAPSPLLVQHSSAGVHVSTTESWEFSKSFNTTIRTYIRSILVRDDIEAYGRKAARKYHLSKSPFGMVKFIGDLVKSEKNSFGALLKVPNSPKCVPKLWSIIADVFAVIDDGHKYASAADINKDRRITPYVKARIAYLTLCQLLLDNERAIWTGKKTINEVLFSDQCLPSDEAIEAQVQKMTHSNSDLSREEDDHFNFEVQDRQSTHRNIRPDEDKEESGSSSGESQSDDRSLTSKFDACFVKII
ncbi:hypothetical protein KEM48_012147 [Puccinia striiformis f. sp. tritici PST-130]|nr:hypothetical protein KEM48_012147 [Puccinia striiformis f. sp. tritici PST-130]